jgi:predicted ArsR family transcriptional regulator
VVKTFDGKADTAVQAGQERQTREAVLRFILTEGPVTAGEIGSHLDLCVTGVRRHLDALLDAGQAREVSLAPAGQRARGRPAKHFQITAKGRLILDDTYEDLAGDALRQLREIGGEQAIREFARKRVNKILGNVDPSGGEEATADAIATAYTAAGFAASTRKVGNGVQICQHHCPVSRVAEQFPELCEAEQDALRELLGTHVQPLALIANGDVACTTHVPLMSAAAGGRARLNAAPTASTIDNSLEGPA